MKTIDAVRRFSAPRALAIALAAAAAFASAGCGGEDVTNQYYQTAPNAAPVADAGSDQSVGEGSAVTLAGSGSFDPDGTVAVHLWTQILGEEVVLSSNTAADPAFTAPAVGPGGAVLVFQLTVIDDKGASGADTVTVTVADVLSPAGQAKYVILLIGDGMHLACEIAASRYLYNFDRNMAWHSFPYQTVCTTWDITCYDRHAYASGGPQYASATMDPEIGYNALVGGDWTYDADWTPPSDAYFLTPLDKYGGGSPAVPATDSASAATAISCGFKTDDGNIAWAPGDPPAGNGTTIAEAARARKSMAIGVVSTVQFSHATPAAFVSHNVNRNNYSEDRKNTGYTGACISEEIIQTVQPDVVIASGWPGFGGSSTGYVSAADYAGLQAGSASPYDAFHFVERATGVSGDTTIAAAATAAISAGKKLFGLFGGSGGYWEHPVPSDTPGSPSFAWTTTENPTLAAAAEAALEVLESRGGTNGFFLMIEGGDIDWANHANDYSRMIGAMYNFELAAKKVVEYVNSSSNSLDWSNTLVILTADHANSYMRFNPSKWLGKGDLPQQAGSSYPDGEVYYGCTSHTNEPVMLYARGVHADLFAEYEGAWNKGTRLVDNTHIYQMMKRALGLN